VGHGEADGAVGLGRKIAEGEAPRRPEVTAALMEEAAVSVRVRRGLGHPFIGKQGEKDRHDEPNLITVLQGRGTTENPAATEVPAGGAGSAQAPWRTGRAPAGES
jgi:hypothetical protein